MIHGPVTKLTDWVAHSVVADHLGTRRWLCTTSAGKRDGKCSWIAMGSCAKVRDKPQDCPFRYPGQYEDQETGLYYNRFRYYSPSEGTYISQDPIGLLSGVLNLYSYVSNPNSLVDIYGLYPLWDPVSMRWRDSVTGSFRTRPTDLVRTKPGEAFFWSGRTNGIGGELIAKDIARSEQGTTMEMLIEKHEIKMPAWDPANPVHTREWGKISEAYAQGSSGQVRGVIGAELRPGNIWEGYEKGALKTNPNVTEIVTIDPSTRARETIHTACS